MDDDRPFPLAIWLGNHSESELADAIRALTPAQIVDAAKLTDRLDWYIDLIQKERGAGVLPDFLFDDGLDETFAQVPEFVDFMRQSMLDALAGTTWNKVNQNGQWFLVGPPDYRHYDGAVLICEAEPLAPPENKRERYSDDDVSIAVNDAANTVGKALGDGMNPYVDSVINLVVNAALTSLKDHGATIDDIFAANWDKEGEQEVREELGLD